jgi:predicted ester cyclase
MMGTESPVMESNKSLVREFISRMLSEPASEVLDQYLAPDFLDHYAPPEQEPGREGVKKVFERARNILSELHVELEDMIAERDRVVIRLKTNAMQVGSFMGFPPTGKEVAWTTISIYRIEGGKIVERWGLMDHAFLLRQLRDAKQPAV